MLYCGLANEGAEEGHAGKWVRLQGSIPALYCGSPAPTRGIEPRLPASHAGGLSNSLGGYRESNQGQTTSTLVASCRPKPATARAPRQRAPFSLDRRPCGRRFVGVARRRMRNTAPELSNRHSRNAEGRRFLRGSAGLVETFIGQWRVSALHLPCAPLRTTLAAAGNMVCRAEAPAPARARGTTAVVSKQLVPGDDDRWRHGGC